MRKLLLQHLVVDRLTHLPELRADPLSRFRQIRGYRCVLRELLPRSRSTRHDRFRPSPRRRDQVLFVRVRRREARTILRVDRLFSKLARERLCLRHHGIGRHDRTHHLDEA